MVRCSDLCKLPIQHSLHPVASPPLASLSVYTLLMQLVLGHQVFLYLCYLVTFNHLYVGLQFKQEIKFEWPCFICSITYTTIHNNTCSWSWAFLNNGHPLVTCCLDKRGFTVLITKNKPSSQIQVLSSEIVNPTITFLYGSRNCCTCKLTLVPPVPGCYSLHTLCVSCCLLITVSI